MIIPDSSVWIDRLRGRSSPAVAKLDQLIDKDIVLTGDIVLLEILQGAHSERHAEQLRITLQRFGVVAMLGPAIAVQAARNYRTLRAMGRTIRRTTDLVIGTYCIEHGCQLLHSDRDFTPMVEHLGLQLAN